MLRLKRSLIIIFLLAAGCSSASVINSIPTSTSPLVPEVVDEAVRFDAQQYAEEYGISTDEALRRFFLMREAGTLQAQLIEKEADTFAGQWIEHTPQFLIVVVFTRNGTQTIHPYLENTHLPGMIELREARITLQELIDAEVQANLLVKQLDLSMIATTSVNIQENKVEIHTAYPDILEARLKKNSFNLPEHVEIVDLENKPTGEVPTVQVTPPAGVFFPQLSVSPQMMYADLNIGTVILEGGCLRMKNDMGKTSVLIWKPGYYLNDNQGVIEVLNRAGEPVARTGEISCYSQAAGVETAEQFLEQPLPESCGGSYSLVGWIVLANREGQDRNLMSVKLTTMEEIPFYIISSKAPSLDLLGEQRDISGKLTLGYVPRARCLYLGDWGGFGGDLLLLWPPGTQACSDNGTPAICDSEGVVVAHLDKRIHLHGSFYQDGSEIRSAVNNELPCDCMGGEYFVITSIEK